MIYDFFKTSTLSALTLTSLLLLAGCPEPEANNGSTDMGGTTTMDDMDTPDTGDTDLDMDGDTGGGDTDADMDTDSGGPITPKTPAEYEAEIQGTLSRAVCRLVVECPQGFDDELISYNQLTSVEECISSGFAASDFESRLPNERQRYNTDEADACLAELTALESMSSCALLEFFSFNKEGGSACERVLEGTLASDAPCLQSEECEGDLYCAYAPDNTECYGTCQVLPPLCEGACNSEQYCDEFTETCEARVAQGEDCDLDEMCMEGLECDYDTFTCETAVPYMEPDPITRIADGEPCTYDYDEFTAWCEQGKTCINVDITTYGGTCGAPLAEGEACTVTDECELGLRCFGVDFLGEVKGTCGNYKEIGETCASSSECADGYCQAGTCAAYTAPGAACSPDTEECEYYCNDNNVCEDFGNGGELECTLP